jgi:hypothetical protein
MGEMGQGTRGAGKLTGPGGGEDLRGIERAGRRVVVGVRVGWCVRKRARGV